MFIQSLDINIQVLGFGDLASSLKSINVLVIAVANDKIALSVHN